MNMLHAILLGVIEGLTEFLPISSTAHLILAARAMGLAETEFLKTFQVAIQLGAILAVVALYGRKLLIDRQLLLRVFVAFVPTAVIGFLLHDFIKQFLFESIPTILWALFLGGIALLAFDYLKRDKATDDGKPVTMKQAFWIGVCQSLAIVPGVSRAAATIVGGELLGVNRKTIVEFSFLLAIPTMMAATGLDLLKTSPNFTGNEWMMLALGSLVAFLVAILSIRWFLKFVTRHSFSVFGIYRILLALTLGTWLML